MDGLALLVVFDVLGEVIVPFGVAVRVGQDHALVAELLKGFLGADEAEVEENLVPESGVQ